MFRVEIIIQSKTGAVTRASYKCNSIEEAREFINIKRVYSYSVKIIKITEEVIEEWTKNC